MRKSNSLKNGKQIEEILMTRKKKVRKKKTVKLI